MESRSVSAARINSGIGEGLVRDEMRRARRINEAGSQVARVIELQSAMSESQINNQSLPPQQTPSPER